MPWIYKDAHRQAGAVLIRLANAQDGEELTYIEMYYGQRDPATDPAFTQQVQTSITQHLAGKEQERTGRLDETLRFRPPPG